MFSKHWPLNNESCELWSDTMAEQIKFALSAFELCIKYTNKIVLQ